MFCQVYCFFAGYYLGFGEIPSALAEATETTGATGTAARVTEFATATEGVTAKTTDTSATIDKGTDPASLTPATEYQVGVTGCIDYTDLTDFAHLTSNNAHQDAAFEMCSPYATILVYTTPEVPKTCTVTTESATELQLTVEQSDDDVNTGTFTVTRDDLDYEFLVSSYGYTYFQQLNVTNITKYHKFGTNFFLLFRKEI